MEKKSTPEIGKIKGIWSKQFLNQKFRFQVTLNDELQVSHHWRPHAPWMDPTYAYVSRKKQREVNSDYKAFWAEVHQDMAHILGDDLHIGKSHENIDVTYKPWKYRNKKASRQS